VNDTLEDTAQRIADRGRDALVERLRPAFREAAAAHGDLLELTDEQIEQMVQRAADRADGLQWRRALAVVATEELGIGLGEALSHPAVERAHAIVGAPAYDESLGPSIPAADHPAEAEAEAVAEPDEFAPSEEDVPPEEAGEPQLRLPAVHVDGIYGLDRPEEGLELRFSDDGLEVAREGNGDAVARFSWPEISELELPPPRRILRRRRQADAQLIVHREQGDVSFEIPGATPEELRRRIAPLLERP
jgi:hypothetical protein